MYLLYEGPSVIDGGPIVALLTGYDRPSTNRKTGPMLQTYILRADVKPTEAIKQGTDKSVCGNCPLRNGACYVNVGHEPTNLFNAYHNKHFKTDNLTRLGLRRRVRLGAYGDPAAVPISVWDKLLKKADGWTGYTHQPLLTPELKRYCQASCETESQAELYRNLGWKTFRVRLPEQPLMANEVKCPYPAMQCNECRMCNGKTQNIVEEAHGLDWKINRFKEAQNANPMELQLPDPVRTLPVQLQAEIS